MEIYWLCQACKAIKTSFQNLDPDVEAIQAIWMTLERSWYNIWAHDGGAAAPNWALTLNLFTLEAREKNRHKIKKTR